MKILFLLTQDLESPSGGGRYWPLARVLAEHGHQVRIVALYSQSKFITTKCFEREGVIVEYVAPMHVIKEGNQKRYYSSLRLIAIALNATIKLSRAVLSSPADIIHVGKPHPMNSLAGLLASRLKRKVLCLDCDDHEAASNHFNSKWQKIVVELFEKWMPRMACLVSTNTYYMKSKLIEWGCPSDHIYYLSNGVDEEHFVTPKQNEVERLRTQLGLNGKRVILYLGTLSLISHPVDLLLESFARAIQIFPDAALLLVGGGEDSGRLISQAEALGIEHVTYFTGRVRTDEVSKYYHLADVSVDPVRDDASGRGRSPLKLFESWAAGVPVVTAGVGDRSFLLGQPPAGVLVEPPGDPRALADGICKVLQSRDFATQLSKLGLERVKLFTWERLAAGVEDKYKRIV
jgi:glycosyltransferase involved in cell wall biosynthesis